MSSSACRIHFLHTPSHTGYYFAHCFSSKLEHSLLRQAANFLPLDVLKPLPLTTPPPPPDRPYVCQPSVIVPHSRCSRKVYTLVLAAFALFVYTSASHTHYFLDLQRKFMATQPPPPPHEKWQCHLCDGGPYLYANTSSCTGVLRNGTQCGHGVCHLCKKDNDIPPPISPGALRSPPTPAKTIYSTAMPRAVPSMAPGTRRDGDRSKYHHHAMELNARPDATGWWICSSCDSLNNPELSCGRCTSCNHTKCPSCRPYRRTGQHHSHLTGLQQAGESTFD